MHKLKQWCETNNEPLEGAYFYSDSHNDLPLLELVDNLYSVIAKTISLMALNLQVQRLILMNVMAQTITFICSH
jgi:phosphoserine phosphatase